MATASVLRDIPPMWREGSTSLEMAALLRSDVWRGAGVPHGDGAPVLLVCGFLAGDPSLNLLARWLRRIGHRPSRAGIRWNVGCGGETVDRLEAKVEALAARYDRPVAIVGQSRGGTSARALAVRRPDLVDRIVTLGSPLVDQLDVHPAVWTQVHLVGILGSLGVDGLLKHSCRNGDCCAQYRDEFEAPMPESVAFTSIYSRDDGIVRWRACLDPYAEHVEVRSSHIGMAANVQVYRALAAALAPVALADALAAEAA
jgi:triacylglycerol lipase